MWKKPLGKYQTQPLKNKDAKAVRRIVGEGLLEKEDVSLWKMDSRLHIYAWGGAPMFVDTSGKLQGQLLPTVYALWRKPGMLQPLYVNAEVSPYILKGADLMWPGVFGPAFQPVMKGQLVAITAVGNPKPFAVGTITVDAKLRPTKGKAVEVLHYYTDFLSKEAKLPAPEGFSPEKISIVELPEEAVDTPPSSAQEPSEEDEELYHEVSNILLADVLEDCSDDEIPEDDEEREDGEEDSDGEKKGKRHARMAALKAKKEGKKGGKKKGGGKAEAESTPEEMDSLIHVCFVGGMASITKADLPMLVSTFYSQHMLPARPEGSTVVLKSSSYKKIGNLMSLMAKEGVVTIKAKSAGVDEIRDINKRARFYQELSKSLDMPNATTGSSSAAGALEEASHFNPEVMPDGKITRVDVLHSVKGDSVVLKTVFGGSREPKTVKEIQAVLNSYIAENEIKTREGVRGGKGQLPDPWVTLNPELARLWSPSSLIERTLIVKKEKLSDTLGFKTNPQLQVVGLDEGGLAKEFGLLVGDTVKEIDGTRVKTIEEMGKQLVAMKSERVITLTIRTKDRCPGECKQSEIMNRLLKHTVPAYSVHHEGGKVAQGKGSVPQISLVIKRRGGNKTLTYVHCLDKFGFDIPGAAQELKIFLAGSVTVMPPIAPYSSTILLQGRQIKKLAAFFLAYNIPKEYILVKDLKK